MERLMDQIEGRELHFNGPSAYVKAFRGFHEGKNPRRSSAKRASKTAGVFAIASELRGMPGSSRRLFGSRMRRKVVREDHGSTMSRINDVRNLRNVEFATILYR